ncbi:MAG: serine recombinase [Proteobacteria bacterium]|nr:serine recombinase [Pseudomonadota bacterium]
MVDGKFIAYYRVSTQKQGESGLGLEAQQAAVCRFLNGGSWQMTGEFVEIESGRKDSKSRPRLVAALSDCKRQGATLIIAKLDRLARDVRFFLEVLDDSGVDIRFAEFADIDPKTDEGRMLLINMANFAEFEGRRIGTRTKAALAAAKARGVALGVAGAANLRANIDQRQQAANAFAASLATTLRGFKLAGLNQRQIAAELNKTGVRTAKGGEWSQTQVQRVMARLGL